MRYRSCLASGATSARSRARSPRSQSSERHSVGTGRAAHVARPARYLVSFVGRRQAGRHRVVRKRLSFETPLKFIFSHSALKEGWDNPNVFQICTLRDIQTERERRQTIGRGLRLCVNQNGTRLRGFEVNTLTVVATESYEQFAESLQKEIEDDSGAARPDARPGGARTALRYGMASAKRVRGGFG
jgi:superfamily II DNA or RNA helicase